MAASDTGIRRIGWPVKLLLGLALISVFALAALNDFRIFPEEPVLVLPPPVAKDVVPLPARPRKTFDIRGSIFDPSGFFELTRRVKPWPPNATLEQIAANWKNLGPRINEQLELSLKQDSKNLILDQKLSLMLTQAYLFNSEGEPAKAYDLLSKMRSMIEGDQAETSSWLYMIIYTQGVTALRRGENENCIMCRGESSCILPIAPAAVHLKPDGSRLAIKHFLEYLAKFPDDLEVRWLLNIAYMTLGEYPEKVDSKYRLSLDRFFKSEFDIGRFRDIGERAHVNRFNQAGGAIMEDFDNDGLLDLAVTSFDPTEHMAIYHNSGDGTFEERTESAGVVGQLGGLYCVQADYNNDGRMDIFIPRGAWLSYPMRPTLLRNDGGTFTDVTEQAKLLDPVNSNSASWADYDNDGFVDLFICCEQQPNHLYHNKGDGTFEEVSEKAGLRLKGQPFCKGSAWIDFDNDRDPDLFLNILSGRPACLFRNNGDGTFSDVTAKLGIDGPRLGFSCWAWDYDNDGFLDIFATCYDRSLKDAVKGLIGEPHGLNSNRLFHNLKGQGFEDVTKKTGLDMVFITMGSNFADFDNDGYLDMYLATGDPSVATLIPNRMFKNVEGKRFSEITASSGTGHLQKGHAVACGDWDRDGDTDLFVQTGGAVNGDKYHNLLFENPGQGNHWLTLKLVGKKTNRAAIGARIKAVTAGGNPLAIHRHVSTGSSFGANTLQQNLGLAKADRVASLEVYWPTSGTTQVFRDIEANQAIEVTEFESDYRKLDWKPLHPPANSHP